MNIPIETESRLNVCINHLNVIRAKRKLKIDPRAAQWMEYMRKKLNQIIPKVTHVKLISDISQKQTLLLNFDYLKNYRNR